jgi:hypothetical protein
MVMGVRSGHLGGVIYSRSDRKPGRLSKATTGQVNLIFRIRDLPLVKDHLRLIHSNYFLKHNNQLDFIIVINLKICFKVFF